MLRHEAIPQRPPDLFRRKILLRAMEMQSSFCAASRSSRSCLIPPVMRIVFFMPVAFTRVISAGSRNGLELQTARPKGALFFTSEKEFAQKE
jgi:hypothetical protein